jgi:hypothetical protein
MMQANVKQRQYIRYGTTTDGEQFTYTVSAGNKNIASEVCTDKVRLRTKTARLQAKRKAIEDANSRSIKTTSQLINQAEKRKAQRKLDKTYKVVAIDKHRRKF